MTAAAGRIQRHTRLGRLHGQITVRTGRERHTLGPGDRIAIAPATPHTWWNSGDHEPVLLAEFRPPGQAQSFFETFCGMASHRFSAG